MDYQHSQGLYTSGHCASAIASSDQASGMSAVPRTSANVLRGDHLMDGVHVHIRAIEYGEAGIAPLESEEEAGHAEQHDLGALVSALGALRRKTRAAAYH
jgi:hypothetical protein